MKCFSGNRKYLPGIQSTMVIRGLFPLRDAHTGFHGSFTHQLDICFDKYMYHDSQQARLIQKIDHSGDLSGDYKLNYLVI